MDQTADMAAALLVDTTSQFTATSGSEKVEVGLNVHMNKRLVVQNISSLSLNSCLLVANKDSFEIGVVSVELVVEKVEDSSVDLAQTGRLQG